MRPGDLVRYTPDDHLGVIISRDLDDQGRYQVCYDEEDKFYRSPMKDLEKLDEREICSRHVYDEFGDDMVNAVTNGNVSIISCFLKDLVKGVETFDNHDMIFLVGIMSILSLAATHNRLCVVKLVFKFLDSKRKTIDMNALRYRDYKSKPLYCNIVDAKTDSTGIVKLLVEKGAIINDSHFDGRGHYYSNPLLKGFTDKFGIPQVSPLFLCILYGKYKVLKFLLSEGADPDQKLYIYDKSSRRFSDHYITPLTFAVYIADKKTLDIMGEYITGSQIINEIHIFGENTTKEIEKSLLLLLKKSISKNRLHITHKYEYCTLLNFIDHKFVKEYLFEFTRLNDRFDYPDVEDGECYANYEEIFGSEDWVRYLGNVTKVGKFGRFRY